MSIFYDMEGRELSMEEWAKTFDSDFTSTRVIERTTLPGDILVSTVLLGIDHNFSDEGPPLIFETMVFAENENDLDMRRYSTKEEAKAGHVEMVKEWTSKHPDEKRSE